MVGDGEVRYALHGTAHLAYRMQGAGPPLLWVPSQFIPISAMDDEPAYQRFLERLSRFSTVITFDRLGIGLSDPLPVEPTVEDWAAQLESVIDAAGFDSAVVVAHAMGGLPAVTLAATRPDRVRGLVLAVAAGGVGTPNNIDPDEMVATARPSDPSSAFDFLAALAPTRSADPAFRSWWERAGRQGASPAVAQQLLALQLSSDVTHLQPHVRVPTLVIDRPKVDRAIGLRQTLGTEIEGARVVDVDGTDVLVWLPDSDAVVAEIEEFMTGERRPDRGPRRLLTVMFADVVGSTPAAARLGDDRWRDTLEAYYALMRREIDRSGGTEMATAGDGFFVTFETPSSAVRCAERMHRATNAIGIQLRVGVHCGEVEIRGPDLAGIAVHIGARVEAQAKPSETWVTSTARQAMTGSDVEFSDEGLHDLKGVAEKWQLFSVTRQS